MMTEQQIDIANMLLATGMVSQVYHSVSLLAGNNGSRFPVYKKGKEEFYVGPDDRKRRFAYIRQSSPVAPLQKTLEGSEQKIYQLGASNRIVIFKDHEQDDFDNLIKKLLAPVFAPNITLLSYQHNAFELAKQEVPAGDFAFDVTTFYIAIDISVTWWMDASICGEECIVYPNPICL